MFLAEKWHLIREYYGYEKAFARKFKKEGIEYKEILFDASKYTNKNMFVIEMPSKWFLETNVEEIIETFRNYREKYSKLYKRLETVRIEYFIYPYIYPQYDEVRFKGPLEGEEVIFKIRDVMKMPIDVITNIVKEELKRR